MSFPLSSRTIGALVRAIDVGYSKAGIGTLVLDAEADRWEADDPPNKATAIQVLFKSMRKDGGNEASAAALDILVRVLRQGDGSRSFSGDPTDWFDEVRDTAAADGFEYDDDTRSLVPTIPSGDMVEHVSIVDRHLKDRGWTTAAGHYRQAVDAFGVGNWASANAQLRSTLEDVIPAAAEDATGNRPSEVQAALTKLQDAGVLDSGEFGVAKGLWSMCQSNGSHPGLSDEDEARFRVVMVTAYLRYLLERLAGT